MTRAVLGLALCAATLGAGLVAAFVASRNRARAGELDRRQHHCETVSRQIELQRALNARREWLLLHEPDSEPEGDVDPTPELRN